MTVAELLAELSALPQNAEVYVSLTPDQTFVNEEDIASEDGVVVLGGGG